MPKVFRIKSSLAYDPAVTLDGGGNGILRFTTKVADTLVVSDQVTGVSRFEIASDAGSTTGTVAANLDISAVLGANVLVGNNGDNVLTGGAGTTAIFGNGGNDTLIPKGPTRLIIGGSGDDTVLITDPGFFAPDATIRGGANGPIGDTLVFDDGGIGSVFNLTGATVTGFENLSVVSGEVALTAREFRQFSSIHAGFPAILDITGSGQIAGPDDLSYNIINYNPTSNADSSLDLSASSSDGLIVGSDFNDNITASNGAVTVDAGLGNDFVRGGSGGDNLIGGDGRDTLIGGIGDDTLDGGTGNDLMVGGRGNDTYEVDSVGDRVIERANQGIDTVNTALSSYSLAPLSAVENLNYFGAGNFTGTGNDLANFIAGSAGADTLKGGAGNDTLDGNGGLDSLSGGSGDDTFNFAFSSIAAGTFIDGGSNSAIGDTLRLFGRDGPFSYVPIDISVATIVDVETLDASTTVQEFHGPFGFPLTFRGVQAKLTSTQFNAFHTLTADSLVLADNGTAILAAGETLKTRSILMADGGQVLDISQGSHSPVLSTLPQLDIFGGNGGDKIIFAGSSVNVASAAGDDLIDGRATTTGFTATGGLGKDTVLGGSGDDRFLINGTADMVAGEIYNGNGNSALGGDAIILSTSAPFHRELFNFTAVTLSGIERLDVENPFLNRSFVDVELTQSQLLGLKTITANNLTVDMANGGQSLDMAAALAAVSVIADSISVNGGNGDDSIVGPNVVASLLGHDGNDTLVGGSNGSILDGGTGNDLLIGGAGTDQLTGGTGVDAIHAGAGSDFIYVNGAAELNAGDVYNGGADTDRLVLRPSVLGELFDLTKVSISNIEVLQADGADVTLSTRLFNGISITAAFSGTPFHGLNNLNFADNGAAIAGPEGFGVNTVNMANGGQSLDLSAISVGVLPTGLTVNGGTGNDLIVGPSLFTFTSLDNLFGGGGNDTLVGGSGPDVLTGGTGNDKFVFSGVSFDPSVRDVITDFTSLQDQIDFAKFDANPATAQHDPFAFIGTNAFSHTAGELRYTHDPAEHVPTGGSVIEADVNGDGLADFQIILTNFTGTLTATDFLL